MNKSDEDRLIRHLVARLERAFPSLEPTLIEDVVGSQLHQYDGSRVRDYIPILVERDVRDILRDLVVAAGQSPSELRPLAGTARSGTLST